MSTRVARSIALLGSVAVWAGCTRGEAQRDTLKLESASGVAAVAPDPVLTDANIFALLDEANAADSAGGHLAASKGTSPAVKEFAHLMMKDHHELRQAGMNLAKKLNITPMPPANDSMPMMATRMLDSLMAQPKGLAWDQAYMNAQVKGHEAVLRLLAKAESAAKATELKAAIMTARPVVQLHLTKAQEIQSKLGRNVATSTRH